MSGTSVTAIEASEPSSSQDTQYTRPIAEARRTLGFGFVAYLVISLLIAIIGGLVTHMSVEMLIGFPPVALALLAGFSAATGPAFADMGYDIATAVKFSIETAKELTNGTCTFYDPQEFAKITELFGSMKILQTAGRARSHDECRTGQAAGLPFAIRSVK